MKSYIVLSKKQINEIVLLAKGYSEHSTISIHFEKTGIVTGEAEQLRLLDATHHRSLRTLMRRAPIKI